MNYINKQIIKTKCKQIIIDKTIKKSILVCTNRYNKLVSFNIYNNYALDLLSFFKSLWRPLDFFSRNK